ncbi:hypothetical protein FA95DRAFT_1571915 [Auriscalpium vulgare]|uniref:Uncharacterized protein n=1 Tax=Auriscalpium vulgare TaxID=40419 RepID=A0ACB8RWK8_9AGAM|nr:hypothetical protein FA95DRAFT_1571915 [Auriscalpium vulgare]
MTFAAYPRIAPAWPPFPRASGIEQPRLSTRWKPSLVDKLLPATTAVIRRPAGPRPRVATVSAPPSYVHYDSSQLLEGSSSECLMKQQTPSLPKPFPLPDWDIIIYLRESDAGFEEKSPRLF